MAPVERTEGLGGKGFDISGDVRRQRANSLDSSGSGSSFAGSGLGSRAHPLGYSGVVRTPGSNEFASIDRRSSRLLRSKSDSVAEGDAFAMRMRQSSDIRGSSHDLVAKPQKLFEKYQNHLDEFQSALEDKIEHGDSYFRLCCGSNDLIQTGEPIDTVQMRELLDIPERKSGSFLILAVKDRQVETIQMLTGNHKTMILHDFKNRVVKMVNGNKQGQLGRTALYEACAWGNEEVCNIKAIFHARCLVLALGGRLDLEVRARMGTPVPNRVRPGFA